MNFAAAYAGTGTAPVDFQATVSSSPHFFYGTHTHCMHEEFDARTPAGPVQVIDNVAIAPRCPVRVGDQVEVRGDMVHDPGKPPIVHWTHHDPEGTHAGGFIRWHGRVYA